MTSPIKNLLASSFSALVLTASPAAAQKGGIVIPLAYTSPSIPGQITHCELSNLDGTPTGKDYTAVRPSTPEACTVTHATAEYLGKLGPGALVTLETLWKKNSDGIVADTRYVNTLTVAPSTTEPGVKQSTIFVKYNDQNIVIEASDVIGRPTLIEVLDANGVSKIAKSCGVVDMERGLVESCTPAQPLVQHREKFLSNQAQHLADAQAYVAFLAGGGSLTNRYFRPKDAEKRLATIGRFVQAAEAPAP